MCWSLSLICALCLYGASRNHCIYSTCDSFFFLTLTERKFWMLWKFDHFMFSVLIGVFVKWMSNLFMPSLLWYYNNLCHICLINAIYFVLLMLSLCFTRDRVQGLECRIRLWSECQSQGVVSFQSASTGSKHKARGPDLALHLVLSCPAPFLYPAAALA